MDEYLPRFRNKVNIKTAVSAKISDIIAQSLSRVDALLGESLTAIPVIFINNDKESGDESVIYSYTKDGVKVGDYLTVFDVPHLIYKKIKNIKREDYIDSFKAVACNITFALGATTVKAYFKGSLRAAQSEESDLAQNFGVDSKGDAFIIVPATVSLSLNLPIVISDKGWIVKFIDNISNAGITYAALEEYNIVDTTKVSENEPLVPPTPPAPNTLPILIAGVTQEFTTENGYIKANKPIEIISRTAAKIKFIIPFGTKEITIETKVDDGLESETYLVRG